MDAFDQFDADHLQAHTEETLPPDDDTVSEKDQTATISGYIAVPATHWKRALEAQSGQPNPPAPTKEFSRAGLTEADLARSGVGSRKSRPALATEVLAALRALAQRLEDSYKKRKEVPNIELAVRSRVKVIDGEEHYASRLYVWSDPDDQHDLVGLMAVIRIAISAIESWQPCPTRTVFYIEKDHFVTQPKSDRAINIMACSTGFRREDFNLASDSNGNWVSAPGAVLVRLTDGFIDEIRDVNHPCVIASELDLKEVVIDLKQVTRVVIIEKNCMFGRLSHLCDKGCLVITGRGCPSIPTRKFVKKISEAYPKLPIRVLTDGDPGGIGIFSTYRNSSISATNEDVAVPNVEWIGLRPTKVRALKDFDFEEAKSELEGPDRSRLENLIAKSNEAVPPEVKLECQFMLDNDCKVRLEDIPIETLWTFVLEELGLSGDDMELGLSEDDMELGSSADYMSSSVNEMLGSSADYMSSSVNEMLGSSADYMSSSGDMLVGSSADYMSSSATDMWGLSADNMEIEGFGDLEGASGVRYNDFFNF